VNGHSEEEKNEEGEGVPEKDRYQGEVVVLSRKGVVEVWRREENV